MWINDDKYYVWERQWAKYPSGYAFTRWVGHISSAIGVLFVLIDFYVVIFVGGWSVHDVINLVVGWKLIMCGAALWGISQVLDHLVDLKTEYLIKNYDSYIPPTKG